ncbi:MAG: tetratricopeptide repeat protein [Gammaproteobacteria bacterium]|nr:tetratricopeptide repeat protein [Gammaproteobacteria bacterium]
MGESPDISLFEELKRRNVFRVGAAYLVSAWVLAQVADLVLDNIASPDWVMQSILVVLGIGFFIALVFAWAYELTTEGLKRENEVDRSKSITRRTGRKLNLIIIGIMAVAIMLLVSERIGLFGGLSAVDEAAVEQPQSVAVLPFANRSADAADQYFVDGIHDDVLTQLSKIRDLKVVSRTSVERFRDTRQSIQDIGAALGAGAIIEGAVQRSGERVRITVQLIESETDEHIWAETYDREISATNIFAIQSEIAIAIAKQLRAKLTDEEQNQLVSVPTESFAAYDLYLQGTKLARQWEPESSNQAADLFRRALDIDPDYARAYAGLCDVFIANYRHTSDTSMVPRAQSYCDRALQIDDSLFEVRLSLGNLYTATGKYEQAEAEFLHAIAIEPKSDAAYRSLGRTYLAREQEGNAEEAFLHAIQLAPENPAGHSALADFHYALGRFPQAIAAYGEAVKRDPDDPGAYLGLGAAKYLNGDFAGTEAAWRKSLSLDGNQPILLYNMGTVFFFEKRFDDALEMYRRAIEINPEDQTAWGAIGDAYRFIGGKKPESAAAYATAIELAERMFQVNPKNVEVASALGRLYATTNRPDKAKEFLDIALTIGSEDMYMWYDRSLTYLALGRIDESIVAVEQLVAKGYSTDILASDVMFAEIAADPRFRMIIEKSAP